MPLTRPANPSCEPSERQAPHIRPMQRKSEIEYNVSLRWQRMDLSVVLAAYGQPTGLPFDRPIVVRCLYVKTVTA